MANYTVSLETENGVKTTTDRFDNSIKTYTANIFCDSLARERRIEYHANPRKPKKNLDPSILESLEDSSSPDTFHLAANGIYLFANDVNVEGSKMTVQMSDTESKLEGCANGGHLMAAIKEANEEGTLAPSKRVPVTIYTGLTKQAKLDIVFGLNNNVEVNEDSHMNMAGKFDFIKQNLQNTPYHDEMVSYFQNDGGVQTILGIIQILKAMMPNDKDFDKLNPSIPKMAYGNAQMIRKDFADNETRYQMISRSLPDILKFRDEIQASVDSTIEKISKVKKQVDGGEKPLALTKNKGKTPLTNQFQYKEFGGAYPKFVLNNGAIYPLMSAFRNFVDQNSIFDLDTALKCWAEIGDELIGKVIMGCADHEEVRKFANADSTWTNLFDRVHTWAEKQGYVAREESVL